MGALSAFDRLVHEPSGTCCHSGMSRSYAAEPEVFGALSFLQRSSITLLTATKRVQVPR